MAGVQDLNELLKSMTPECQQGEYVFCSVKNKFSDYEHLQPLACFMEPEGLTLILPAKAAEKAGLVFENKFKQITLTVHSSLDAVGLTAAVASKLASCGISANVVAAYYHDHIFVQTGKAEKALAALRELSAAEN
jgi:hypothetical protein